MKKRKNLVLALLLVASLILGIGYAAVTDVLDINGNADVDQVGAQEAFNEDVHFAVNGAVANDAGNVAEVTSDNDVATFTASNLKGQGDTATFTFTIVNEGDLDAVVTPSLAADGNTNAEYFAVSSDWNGQAKDLAAGASITYTVTVELLKTPTDYVHGAFHIELTAVAD
jgi:hypothetical protein